MAIGQLRRSGGSLTLTIPAAYRKAHHLSEGDVVEIETDGESLHIRAISRPKVTLQAILDSAPDQVRLAREPGWDEMTSAGRES